MKHARRGRLRPAPFVVEALVQSVDELRHEGALYVACKPDGSELRANLAERGINAHVQRLSVIKHARYGAFHGPDAGLATEADSSPRSPVHHTF